jgi:SPP1 gp7 family putative phage head morphogenesis protein
MRFSSKQARFTEESARKSLLEFREAGFEKYFISTCGDGAVCPTCEGFDGKMYFVNEAIIGVTAPPFCEECRCIITLTDHSRDTNCK